MSRYLRWAVGTWFSLKILVVMFRYMLEFERPVLCLRTSFWGTAGIRHKHRFNHILRNKLSLKIYWSH